MRASAVAKKQIIKRPFTTGALVLSAWFLWHFYTNVQYGMSEWFVYYLVALIAWEPAAAWLRNGGRWVPAAELFFLLHLQYYVNPFVSGKEEIIELQPGIRIRIGIVIALFLLVCRGFYSLFRFVTGASTIRNLGVLDRHLDYGPKQYIVWTGLAVWTVFNIALQRGWLPDLGSNFNLIRTIFSAAGTLSIFVLFHEFGKGHMKRIATYILLSVTTLCLFWSISSGFLVGATVQAAVSLVAYSIGRKKVPITSMIILIAILGFLHIGKMEMRAQFWDEGKNYSSKERSVFEIYQFWVNASWNRLASTESDDAKLPSIFDRGSLLQYLARVVDETPDERPYLNGNSYLESFANFVPRFIWPDKPAANAANDNLSIHYGFQTAEGVLKTSVGLGILCEAWANWGWFGVCLIGVVMGVIICIPSRLSINSSPTQFRFLFSVPFIIFAINLELILGQAIQSLLQGLVASFFVLLLLSKSPVTPRADSQANNQPQLQPVIN